MQKFIITAILTFALMLPALPGAAQDNGCSPKYAALGENALVTFSGTGDMDITVVTDPLCWHCRLGHKLLGEYPELYGTVRLVFFPRKSFIGSDMAAWILEDAVKSGRLQEKIDFAYKHLKQPKTKDLHEAREVVLSQFLIFFPEMLEGTDMDSLFARLKAENEPHVLKTTTLGEAAELPGTPVLIAGRKILVGYGAGPWLKVLKEKALCE